MTAHEILFAGEEQNEDEDFEDMFYEEHVIHGVPVLVDEEGYIYFDSAHHESIFNHSDKMQLKATRQQSMQHSKRQPQRHFAHQRRVIRGYNSRKR